MQPSSIIPMQHQTLPSEGLALTWDPVPGAIRYAFIIGLAGVPAPPIEAIMGGRAREFALLGVPVSFTGAALIGAAGEDRQLGVMAYMADGSSIPVPNLQFHSARRAPRDRQYHPLLPPALAASPASAQPAAAPPQQERMPTPLTPLRGGDPWDALDRAGNATPAPAAPPTMAATPTAPDAAGGLPMQQQRLAREGLSLLWDPMPDAIRYGLVAGVVGMPPPAIEALMRGGSRQFTVLGIPARFTGATILGSTSEEDRQFCLIAWRADGTMAPVSGIRFLPVRAAPRDRDYHPLTPPSLEAAPGAGITAPSYSAPSPIQSAPPIPVVPATPPMTDAARRQTAAEAFAAMMAARQTGQPVPPPPAATPPPVPVVPPVPQRPVDPWDLLGVPSAAEEERAAPTPWVPAPIAHMAATPPPVPVAPPQSADPWDLLGPPREQDTVNEGEESSDRQQIPSLPDPWDLLKEPESGTHEEEWIGDVSATTPVLPAADTAMEAPAHEPVSEPRETQEPEAAPAVAQPHPVAEIVPVRAEEWPERAAAAPPPAPVDERRPSSAETQAQGTSVPAPTVGHEGVSAAAADAAMQRSETAPINRELEQPAAAVAAEIVATPEVVSAPAATAIVADSAVTPNSVPARPLEDGVHAAGPQGAVQESERQVAVPLPVGPADSIVTGDDPDQAARSSRQERIEPVANEPVPAPAEAIGPISAPERPGREAGDQFGPVPIAAEPAGPDAPRPEPEIHPVAPRQDEIDPVATPPTTRAEAPPVRVVDEVSTEPGTPIEAGPGATVPIEGHGTGVVAEEVTPSAEPIGAAAPAEPEPVPLLPAETEPSAAPPLPSAATPATAAGVDRVDEQPKEPDAAPFTEPDIVRRSDTDAAALPIRSEPPIPAAPDLEGDADSVVAGVEPASLDTKVATPAVTQAPVVPTSEEPVVKTMQPIEPPAAEKEEPPATDAIVIPRPKLESGDELVEAREAVEPEGAAQPSRAEPAPLAAEAEVAGPTAALDGLAPKAQLPEESVSVAEERRAESPRDDSAPLVAGPAQAIESARSSPSPVVASEDVWLTDDTTSTTTAATPPPAPTIPMPVPAPVATRPAALPPPDTRPLAPALAALLEEAELYLLPQWADYAEVARLLDQIEQAAPNHVRVREVRAQLQQAQQDAAGDGIATLLVEAEECIGRQDFWGAVDIYEQALQRQPGHEEARRGIERARMLARWSAQISGAGTDPDRLIALGNEYAGAAPDLARQAYAAAFAGAPTVSALRGLLLAHLHSGDGAAVAEAARVGMHALQQRVGLQQSAQLDEALAAIARCGEPNVDRQEAERAIGALLNTLETAIGSSAEGH